MAPSRDREASGLKGVSLGAELAAALVGFALLGLWIDRHFGTSPSATLICLAVGFIGGFYNFIRSSLRIMRPPPTSLTTRSEATATSETVDSDSPDSHAG